MYNFFSTTNQEYSVCASFLFSSMLLEKYPQCCGEKYYKIKHQEALEVFWT